MKEGRPKAALFAACVMPVAWCATGAIGSYCLSASGMTRVVPSSRTAWS